MDGLQSNLDPTLPQRWQLIDVSLLKEDKFKRIAHRLNCFGSLYYFLKVCLRKHRLDDELHRCLTNVVEKTTLKEIVEFPRDHFKTTAITEGASIWWALPFNDEDADYMRKLGYSEEFIRWMRRAHDRNTRTLIVSEVSDNAVKIAIRISKAYTDNDFFRWLFPEIIPDSSCVWNTSTMTHLRDRNVSPQGEGTYDVLGAGGALQSRHYNRIIQDDMVGKKASQSEVVMDDIIEYHKLLVGAFDADPADGGRDNDEIIVGNRWSYRDLNSWVRENEPYFNVTNHSALGGCCDKHPFGTPIFPKEFSVEKLERWKKRLGPYLFSCQFLNNPTPPGDTYFKKENLRRFRFETVSREDMRIKIVHAVKEGEVIKDVMPAHLQIAMVVDPNHAGNEGRCRHAITVVGVYEKPFRVYLLDCWAESCDYGPFISKMFELVNKWKLRGFWLETIAAQKYLKFHLDYRIKLEQRKIKVWELKVDKTANAKNRRIETLQPFSEEGQFWCKEFGQENFEEEWASYPHGKTKDILDTLGYAPQTWKLGMTQEEVTAIVRRGQDNMRGVGIAGY